LPFKSIAPNVGKGLEDCRKVFAIIAAECSFNILPHKSSWSAFGDKPYCFKDKATSFSVHPFTLSSEAKVLARRTEGDEVDVGEVCSSNISN